MSEPRKVPKRIAQTVLNSLKGGVVPRIGLPYIMVGRKREVEALLKDVDIISVQRAAEEPDAVRIFHPARIDGGGLLLPDCFQRIAEDDAVS